MRRLVPATSLVCLLAGCAFLLSCSSGTPTRVVTSPIPASVSLAPGPKASVELGKTLTFSPSARNGQGNAVVETFTYQSSDPSVLTISNSGIACGGVWDSVTSPVVCTPGGTGIALVTAIANGVSSPPVTVYVHQHVTKVVIQKVPAQPPTLSTACFSSGAPSGPETALYEGFAYGGPGGVTDLTTSVGPFSWGTATLPGQGPSRAVVLSSPSAAAPINQEIATAGVPGSASIFATVAGVTSQPLQFTTCPVQSISLQLAPGSSLSLGSPGSATVNADVKDTLGMTLTGVPLTWASSSPQSVAVTTGSSSVFGSVGTIAASTAGKGAITAACTPPSCNGGFTPSMPVYPTTSLTFQVASTSAPPNPTAYVTTSGCIGTTLSCTTRIIPITKASSTAQFSTGAPVNLPSTPDSFSLGRSSTGISFLGVDSTGFNSQGLMILSGGSASQVGSAAGRVLAVSPDSSTVILSDTVDSPSRINICKNCNTSGRTVSTIFFHNASAAAFSPDSLKAYIVSSSPCPGGGGNGCMLVYSQVDSPQYVPLSGPASDAAFIGNGSVGFIAEGGQSEFLPTCGPNGVGALGSVSLSAQFLRPLSDGMSLLAFSPPSLQIVTVGITGSATANAIGCPAPRGFLNIISTLGPVINLGTGSFVAKQFFLSLDTSKAYILAQTGTGAHFPFILVFDVASGTSSQISLAGNAIPLSAGVSPAGDLLLVGASDNSVHVIDTQSGLDLQQVALSFPNASLCIGPGNPATQVAIASLTISSAQQSGTNTIFTYSLQNGATPQVGQTLVLTGMSDGGNNGTFTILAVNAATSSSGTITVSNPAGVAASGQAGTGTVPLTCNPDLLVVP
jgi:hypothetical protein